MSELILPVIQNKNSLALNLHLKKSPKCEMDSNNESAAPPNTIYLWHVFTVIGSCFIHSKFVPWVTLSQFLLSTLKVCIIKTYI